MTEYALYLESGPMRRKTMAHVLALLGCTARGATTDEAVAAAPGEIDRYRRFLAAIGEPVAVDEPVTTRVAQHITEGIRLGEGDPYLLFDGEAEPTSAEELETWVRRFLAMRQTLASWADAQTDATLDAPSGDPASKRTARAILLHVLGPSAQYVSAVLGPTPEYSAAFRCAERGEASLGDALVEAGDLLAGHLRAATEEQRTAVVERPREVRTLRRSVRTVLEHEWEHLAELARRPGGPSIPGTPTGS